LIFNEFAVRNQTILSLTALLIIIIILEIIAGRLFVSNPAGPGKDYPIYITSVIIGIAVLAAVSVTDMIRNVCSKKALVIGLYLTEMSLLAYTVVNFNRFSLWSAVLMVMLFYYVFLTESQFVTDSLTGVMNANAFSRMIMDFQPTSRTAVVIADVDNLPVVNQKRNTHTGDIYLRLVSRQLTSHFLNIGMVYRISGAEFCIICQQTDKDELNQILANCKANLRQLLTGDRYGLRIEFGYAFFQPKDGRLTSTMGRAQKSVE
jgi:diguanylate cyclase (GGDEF)-like protein